MISSLTVIVIAIFVFYNNLGEGRAITHSKLLKLKNRIDIKSIEWLTKYRDTTAKQIDNKLERFSALIVIATMAIFVAAAAM